MRIFESGKHVCQGESLPALAIAGLFFAVTSSLLPIASRIQFGGDEGYELQKALMMRRGFDIYGNFWNDQPPLHTAVLCGLFTMFGPSPMAPRLLSVACGSVVLFVACSLAAREFRNIAAIGTAMLLVSSKPFVELSVSAMLEMPCVALASVSMWLAIGSAKPAFLGGILAGIPMGFALQTKLIAALYIPAVITAMILGSCGRLEQKRVDTKRCAWSIAGYLVGTLSAFLAVFAFFPDEFHYSLVHFRPSLAANFGPEYGFSYWEFVRQFPQIAVPLLGLLVVVRNRVFRSSSVWVPVAVQAAVVLCAFTMHRPFWDYYFAHIYFPLSILGGIGCGVLFKELSKSSWPGNGFQLSNPLVFSFGVMLTILTTIIPNRVIHEYRRLGMPEAILDEEVIHRVQGKAHKTRWFFTFAPIYAFHSGLLTPPELTVVSKKRLMSGGFDSVVMTKILEKYRPEQMILYTSFSNDDAWELFLNGYAMDFRDGGVAHYIRKEISLLTP